MSTEVSGHEKYYIPEKSSIPIIFAAATLFVGYGAANAVVGNGTFMLFMGMVALVATMAFWWAVVIRGITSRIRYTSIKQLLCLWNGMVHIF